MRRKQISSLRGVWPRPLDLARPSPGLSDTVHQGILTGNVSHVLDAGSDQEAQSVGEKGEKKPMKKNHEEVGDSNLEETEIMPTLSPLALLDGPTVPITATAGPALSAFHVLTAEDSS